MNLVLPVEGGSSGTWATILDTMFALVDAHDHTTGKGVKVVSAALNLNADVAWNTHAATGLLGAGFTETTAAAVAGYADLLWSQSSDHNLYFRNSSGVNVQITAGNTLNISIVGGIGGDYASVAALLDFTDATHTYGLKQQVGSAVRQYAKAAHADLQLFEFKANPAAGVPANAVTLQSPTGLGAGYTIQFPAAVPGSTVVPQVSAAGVMTFSNTLISALTVPGLSHTDVWEYPVPLQPVAALTTNTAYDADHISVDSTGINWAFETQVLQGIRNGDRLKSIIATITTGGGTVSYDLYQIAGGTASVLGIGGNLAAGTNTTNLAAAYTLLAGNCYYLHFNGTANGAKVAGVKLVFDHP
jgi:hypothetical protein